jgi:hypothetical protein
MMHVITTFIIVSTDLRRKGVKVNNILKIIPYIFNVTLTQMNEKNK